MTRINILTIFSLFAVFFVMSIEAIKRDPHIYPPVILPVCGDEEEEAGLIYLDRTAAGQPVPPGADPPCRCLCVHTDHLIPVCADNGRTYINTGAVTCHNTCYFNKIRIVRQGHCREGDQVFQ